MDRLVFVNNSIWLTPDKAARKTGVRLVTVNRLIQDGKLSVVMGRVRLSDIKEAISAFEPQNGNGSVLKPVIKKQKEAVGGDIVGSDPILVQAFGKLKVYSLEQAARRLKVKVDDVKRLARSGRLRSRSDDANKVYIIASSLDALERKIQK